MSTSRLGFAMGALLVAAGLAFPAGASAIAEHAFLGTFCEPSGLGKPPCAPSFIKPVGLAIDQSNGDVLVIDAGAETVSRYHSNGTPSNFSALSATNVIDGKAGEADATPQEGLSFAINGPRDAEVAVDNSGPGEETDGNIYLTQTLGKLVDTFDSNGSYLGQLTEFEEGLTASGPLKELGLVCGVGVGPDGSVYVGDFTNNEVHKYEPSGAVPANADNTLNFPATKPCTLAVGAGPTAGFVFVTEFNGAVRKFDSSTGELKYVVASGVNTTVTVNPESGHVYVVTGPALTAEGPPVKEYDASGASEAILLSEIDTATAGWGIGVEEASANVYLAERGKNQIKVWGPAVAFPLPITGEANPIGPTSATLNGTVNPEGIALSECFFEWGETTTYDHVAPCEEPDAEEVGSGTSPVPVHAEISGLQIGTTYHFRLAAANANNSPGEPSVGEDEAFLTLGASIKDEAASLITATSARLNAKVNPNGEETTFLFEYVTDAQFEESEENEESGFAEATVVPESPGEVGSGSAFKEVGVQLLGLEPDTTYHFRIAATTPAATNVGLGATFTTFAVNPDVLPDNRAYELVSPPQKIGEVFPPEPYNIWTGSCGNCLPGVVEGQTAMQAADSGEEVAYEGSPFTGGLAAGTNEYLAKRSPSGWGTQSLTTPLFSNLEKQGYQAFSADLSRAVIYQIEPALTEDAPIGEEGKSYANLYLRAEDGSLTPLVLDPPPNRVAGGQSSDGFVAPFVGANAGSGLTPPLHHVIFEANDALTPDAPSVPANENNLYEWVDGELRLVNLAPDNSTPIAGTVFGSGRELGGGDSGADFDGAISEDGSHIFFSEKESGQVYVRIGGQETKEVNDSGKFLLGSGDGTKVLLADGCLYVVEGEGEGECEEDLSQGQGGFEGILGATSDLSSVYFVDTKELAPGAEDTKPNLYHWKEGATKFIATLLPNDNKFNGTVLPQVGDWMPSSSSRTAQVSPDGRFLAFMSRAELTEYDNHVRNGNECRGGEPAACFEVFEYRADTEELLCASCNPSGQRPLGTANLSLINRGKNLAALAGFPQPSNLTEEEGRLFFESQDALTLGDINGNIKDVYEWEPQGVGDCERAAGCISLISSGQSPNDSMFFDATPSGEDAFFITRERLLPPDQDERLDLYDARAGGGIKEIPTPPCGGEPCRVPSTPAPALQGPASAGFSGPGNVHPKHKKKHHKHKKHKHRKRGGSR